MFENDCQDSLVVLWSLTSLEKDPLAACLWQAAPYLDLLYCFCFYAAYHSVSQHSERINVTIPTEVWAGASHPVVTNI